MFPQCRPWVKINMAIQRKLEKTYTDRRTGYLQTGLPVQFVQSLRQRVRRHKPDCRRAERRPRPPGDAVSRRRRTGPSRRQHSPRPTPQPTVRLPLTHWAGPQYRRSAPPGGQTRPWRWPRPSRCPRRRSIDRWRACDLDSHSRAAKYLHAHEDTVCNFILLCAYYFIMSLFFFFRNILLVSSSIHAL